MEFNVYRCLIRRLAILPFLIYLLNFFNELAACSFLRLLPFLLICRNRTEPSYHHWISLCFNLFVELLPADFSRRFFSYVLSLLKGFKNLIISTKNAFSFCGCKVNGFFSLFQILFKDFFKTLKSSKTLTERGFRLLRLVCRCFSKADANIETIFCFATPAAIYFSGESSDLRLMICIPAH